MATRRIVEEVFAERRRQQTAEGWTHDHDDQHTGCEMAAAASCYAWPTGAAARWPWAFVWFKPKGHRRNLVRAAALIVAEIELSDEAESFTSPDWLGDEVTDDPRYFNANLVEHPFCRW